MLSVLITHIVVVTATFVQAGEPPSEYRPGDMLQAFLDGPMAAIDEIVTLAGFDVAQDLLPEVREPVSAGQCFETGFHARRLMGYKTVS